MRVLLTGASGLLGTWMSRTAPPDIEVVATRHRRQPAVGSNARTVELDLLDAYATARTIERTMPDRIVHLAYDKDLPAAIVEATAYLVAAEIPMVFASTDNVFSGDGRVRHEHEPPDPVNRYGRDKTEAEAIVATDVRSAIVRLPLLVSVDPDDANVEGLRAAASKGTALTWFEQEVRQPAFAIDVATALWRIATRTDGAGVWHLPGPEAMSRPAIGRALAALVGIPDPGVLGPSPPSNERPRDLRLGDQRARASLGWRPTPITESQPGITPP